MKKSKLISVFLILNIFLSQGCGLIFKGFQHKFPITSTPIGAKVTIDHVERGNTPLEIELSRSENHTILIEKKGYDPVKIHVTRKKILDTWIVIMNMGWGLLASAYTAFSPIGNPTKEERRKKTIAFLGVWGLTTSIDLISGSAINTLTPKEINVTMTIKGIEPHPRYIFFDADKFQQVNWIRIKYEDSSKTEEIAIKD